MHALQGSVCLIYNLGMAQLPALEARGLTAAVQDYAKAIYTLESRDGEASTTALATLLEVRPASVSGMLRKLSALGLVEHERYRGVRLTARGRRVALEVIRHHRLDELIAAKLGNPTVDPHGDPIPSRELKLAEKAAPALVELEPGETATFVRISDTDPEMLRFLGERGIVPGTKLEVVDRQPFDGPLFVRVGGKVHALGSVLARAMRVEAA